MCVGFLTKPVPMYINFFPACQSFFMYFLFKHTISLKSVIMDSTALRDQCMNIKFLVKQGKLALEFVDMLKVAYGNMVMILSKIPQCISEYNASCCQESVIDDTREAPLMSAKK